jgi:hypothetical protein
VSSSVRTIYSNRQTHGTGVIMRTVFLFILLSLLFGCESLLDKPNNTVDAMSVAINETSRTLDTLEKQGYIDSDDESRMQRRLAYAHSLLLNPGAALLNDGQCTDAKDRLACAESILQTALELLPKEPQ